ncbi:MAG: hypothetical protein LWX56_10035 [Ignavibacteria bacterium]|nr:hypothetical protein [Ignavibacteria bacterium]
MKILVYCIVFSVAVLAQSFTAGTAYHINGNGTLMGISGSYQVRTWNHEKVSFRLGAGYYTGSNWNSGSSVETRDRFEINAESYNFWVQDRPYFTVLQIGGHITHERSSAAANDSRTTNSGIIFGAGVGMHITAPLAFSVRYMVGKDHGLRLGMHYTL